MVRGRWLKTGACAGACAAAAVAMLVSSGVPANASQVSSNLLQNGTAEAGPGGTGGVVGVPGWKRTTGTTFTAVRYGTPGFPSTTSPAPHNRGKNFFAGGKDPASSNEVATETISLASWVSQIKTGKVVATAAGWFGGKGAEKDMAGMEIDFKDGTGAVVGTSLQVGFVTASQRHNVTGLLHSLANHAVPKQARSAYVQLIFDKVTGPYNDGYADNVTLTLTASGGGPDAQH